MADIALDDMVYIAHLKVGPGDWGMLALVGPIQAKVEEGRETMNQWAALLSVALEHEAVLKTMREQEEHLRRAALYDELTGLPNRAYFRTRLNTAMSRAGRRPEYKYAVLMLDLDGFKLVNDSLGHHAGDRLLEQVATRLSNNLRSIDTAARFGGDEFAILMEEITDTNGPSIMAERLQKALSAPHDLADTTVVVSASIGIAIGTADYNDTETLMRDADAAMYYAKTHGKRSHAIFDPTMHAAAVNRLQIEGELRHALEHNELALYYQSIVDLRTHHISGAEALIRWHHPTRGLLGPAEFLTVAEDSGLILPIGNWVLDEACRQMNAWHLDDPPSTPFMMSINVSNRQFWQSHLIDDVEHRLRTHGLDPSRLAIEITEGVIMDDVKQASAKLNGLKTMGVQVHIDDFGTGYSSLEALHDLSIHALKIDRSFISRLTTSPRSRELVRTIVTMGLNLDLDVIAEGIETPQELDIVTTLGCTHGQGYLFTRPIPAHHMKTLIDTPTPHHP
jgi:diguanylate cyclase (GGDEF)-like protein